MNCPRCVQSVAPGLPQCVRCGFQLSTLDSEFGEDVVLLDRLTDAAHCLRSRDRAALNEALDDFERQFPQLFAAVYLGVLPEMTSIRQFGFWLINHAAVPTVEVSRPNEQGIVIVVDLQSRVIGVTLGYMLEAFVTEKDLEECLRAARPCLFNGDFHRGVCVFLRRFSRVLRAVSRRARRNPEKYAPPLVPVKGKPLFTKLKDIARSSPPVSVGDEDVFEPILPQLDLGLPRKQAGNEEPAAH